MLIQSPIVEGRLQRRYKRFLADIELADGTIVTAHCPNPGSMLGNAHPGARVWLKDAGPDHLRQGRKLRYQWWLVDAGAGRVCIDTSISNAVVREGILAGKVQELGVAKELLPEFSVGDSRLDFLMLDPQSAPVFIEVKAVSMGVGPYALFPDAVTKRGLKHLQELAELRLQGHRAVLFFLVVREGMTCVRPADWIDSDYGETLREVAKLGVEVLAYDVNLETDRIELADAVPVDLQVAPDWSRLDSAHRLAQGTMELPETLHPESKA